MTKKQGQKTVFEDARRTVSDRLPSILQTIDFDGMIKLLAMAITDHKKKSYDTLRHFSRSVLCISKYDDVRGWLTGTASMSKNDIVAVLFGLAKLPDLDKLDCRPYRPANRSSVARNESTGLQVQDAPMEGMRRKVAEHLIGSFNSLANLVSRLTPGDFYDGDRMQLGEAMQIICRSTGITVKIECVDESKFERLTAEDMKEIGG